MSLSQVPGVTCLRLVVSRTLLPDEAHSSDRALWIPTAPANVGSPRGCQRPRQSILAAPGGCIHFSGRGGSCRLGSDRDIVSATRAPPQLVDAGFPLRLCHVSPPSCELCRVCISSVAKGRTHRALLAHSDFLPKRPVRPFPPPLKRCMRYRRLVERQRNDKFQPAMLPSSFTTLIRPHALVEPLCYMCVCV